MDGFTVWSQIRDTPGLAARALAARHRTCSVEEWRQDVRHEATCKVATAVLCELHRYLVKANVRSNMTDAEMAARLERLERLEIEETEDCGG